MDEFTHLDLDQGKDEEQVVEIELPKNKKSWTRKHWKLFKQRREKRKEMRRSKKKLTGKQLMKLEAEEFRGKNPYSTIRPISTSTHHLDKLSKAKKNFNPKQDPMEFFKQSKGQQRHKVGNSAPAGANIRTSSRQSSRSR